MNKKRHIRNVQYSVHEPSNPKNIVIPNEVRDLIHQPEKCDLWFYHLAVFAFKIAIICNLQIMIYRALDIFFTMFHTTLILFNLFGWIWKKTRLLNLAVLLLTGGSWLLLGALVGTPGYCPLTDWHFSILYKLGYRNLPSSYIKYLADRITGLDFDPHLADNLTLILFIAALILSAILNLRDITSVRKQGKNKEN